MKMDWQEAFSCDEDLQADFFSFLKNYGNSGLKQAMRLYMDKQQEYICRTRNSISKFKISDIYYLTIREHNITVYTHHGAYHKYGTLSSELDRLSVCGFLKCNQSCIVSLDKIRTIRGDEIILINNGKIHMSRKYALKVIMEFSHRQDS